MLSKAVHPAIELHPPWLAKTITDPPVIILRLSIVLSSHLMNRKRTGLLDRSVMVPMFPVVMVFVPDENSTAG